MINLTDKLVEHLNSLKKVSEFPSNFKTPTLNSKVGYKVRNTTGGVCLFTKEFIKKNEVICIGDGSMIDKPIIYSYQIEDSIHLVGPGGLDHNCQNPNCRIESGTNNFIAIRDIEKDEYLTFNYLTTEFDMNNSFICSCGEELCFKKIKGFKYRNDKEKDYICKNFYMSDFLKKKYLDSSKSI